MEPITHFLTGACIGRAGFNRKTAYATLAATLAAEAPDLDIFWGLAGPVEGLKHHRGITHTFIAVPIVAAAATGAAWLLHRWRQSRERRRASNAGSAENPSLASRQQVRWGWVYLTAFIAAASHILLDWTNNYGVRPFFPFNPRWYAGSFIFIAEPVLWALLLSAMIFPWLLALADREIGVRRTQFRGRGWAIFALTGMVIVWGWRWSEHADAEAMLNHTQVTAAAASRVALEPYPVNPFRWHAILETRDYYQTAEVNTHAATIDSEAPRDVLYKPTDTPAVEVAKQTSLGQAYLDWGTWAVVRDIGQFPIPGVDPPQLPAGRTWTTVEFSDLRFAYSFSGSGRSRGSAALGAWAYIVDNRDEAAEGMGNRVQK
ncbi:MAG TPA: metal-dependent hydrolase [Terracidiphilus sp.]|nr:metal-dependent hydrolase [Terracidiphilus sp.]